MRINKETALERAKRQEQEQEQALTCMSTTGRKEKELMELTEKEKVNRLKSFFLMKGHRVIIRKDQLIFVDEYKNYKEVQLKQRQKGVRPTGEEIEETIPHYLSRLKNVRYNNTSKNTINRTTSKTREDYCQDTMLTFLEGGKYMGHTVQERRFKDDIRKFSYVADGDTPRGFDGAMFDNDYGSRLATPKVFVQKSEYITDNPANDSSADREINRDFENTSRLEAELTSNKANKTSSVESDGEEAVVVNSGFHNMSDFDSDTKSDKKSKWMLPNDVAIH